MNRDFRDLFSAFSAADVRFLVVDAIGLLDLDDLITSKRAAGRPQGQLDLEWLEKAKKSKRSQVPDKIPSTS
ncbi:MAG TPA: hypothetical protein VGK45_10110 [Thermoanaerobaculia bacterium]